MDGRRLVRKMQRAENGYMDACWARGKKKGFDYCYVD